ncbi:MAG: HPF/RaiA family ribosome-associated protein, partial [Chloroflexota bacterium]
SHIVEVTLLIDGRPLRTHAAAVNHRAGVDEVVDKLERRAVDHLEKPRVRARPEQEKQILRRIADGTATNDRERQIVKTKRFAIEPMFEEDAAAEMEELGHQFFVFVNAENERVNILYRRNDGDLGLIEPIVGGEYTKGRSKAHKNGNN